MFGKSRLITEGIAALLSVYDDLLVKQFTLTQSLMAACSPDRSLHVLVFFLDQVNPSNIELIATLSEKYPGLKILIVALSDEDDVIYKTIRAGACGFLNHDAGKEELYEAILTIRSGYDYYSKSISRIVINQYIKNIDQPEQKKDLLSAREIEILKLWGESLTNKEIADKLFISIRTVETHKNRIMQKINLKTSVDLMKFAIKNDIIQL